MKKKLTKKLVRSIGIKVLFRHFDFNINLLSSKILEDNIRVPVFFLSTDSSPLNQKVEFNDSLIIKLK